MTQINNTVKPFWIMFFKDPADGSVFGSVCGHNARADYKTNPYYIGCHEIEVDMEKLK